MKQGAIPYFHIDVHEDLYQTTLDEMAEILEALDPCVSPIQHLDQSSFARSDASSLSLKQFPPIKLPPFSEDVSEWETFRDRFTALIMLNKDLSDFSRMHYLALSLNGGARDTIANITITADNFQTAWRALTNRYENKQKLIELHVSTLYHLPGISRESAAELHKLRNAADKAISSLRRLNRTSEDILSDILVYFVSLKLDAATRRA